MIGLVLGLLVGLEVKHFIADYLLQPAWILAGKGDVRLPGGYAHAGIHAALTLVVLLVCGTPLSLALALFAGEFVLHYALDYAKIHYSNGVHMQSSPRAYWALHGADQLAHQVTYAGIIFLVLQARGLA
jgi:hypothetical protein